MVSDRTLGWIWNFPGSLRAYVHLGLAVLWPKLWVNRADESCTPLMTCNFFTLYYVYYIVWILDSEILYIVNFMAECQPLTLTLISFNSIFIRDYKIFWIFKFVRFNLFARYLKDFRNNNILSPHHHWLSPFYLLFGI